MKISLAEMSRIYQNYLKDEKPAGGEDCPAVERVVACALAEMPQKERAGIVGHIASCPACAALLKEALGASRAADKFTARVEAMPDRQPHAPARRGVAWIAGLFRRPALAALAGLAMIAIVTLAVVRLRDVSATRGGLEPKVVLVSPVGGLVSREAIEFQWAGVDRARHYTLELFDGAMKRIWQSGPVTTNTFRPANETCRDLAPGKYFWRVTAVGDERFEAKSRLGEFSLTK